MGTACRPAEEEAEGLTGTLPRRAVGYHALSTERAPLRRRAPEAVPAAGFARSRPPGSLPEAPRAPRHLPFGPQVGEVAEGPARTGKGRGPVPSGASLGSTLAKGGRTCRASDRTRLTEEAAPASRREGALQAPRARSSSPSCPAPSQLCFQVFRKSGSEDDFWFRGGRGGAWEPLRRASVRLTRSDWAASAGETELPGTRGGKAGSRGRFRRCSLRRGGAFAPGPSPRLE